MRHLYLLLLSVLITIPAVSQRSSEKSPRSFSEPFMTDSASTLFFPTLYKESLLSTNKVAFWDAYYANIVVYDFKTDTYRKLFSSDTYIAVFARNYNTPYMYNSALKPKNITQKWVLLMVKTKDTNNSGRIDGNDPFTLYVTTVKGEDLKPLTDNTENVVSFDVYEKQGFALIKLQRDVNKDQEFTNKDDDYYFRKLDLQTLTLGKPVEWSN